MTFPLALFCAHLFVIGVAAFVLWRWRARLRKPVPAALWVLFVLADGMTLAAGTAIGMALLILLHQVDFALLRFFAQVLFGEIPLALLAVSGLHLRTKATRSRAFFLTVPALLLLCIYADAYHHCPYDLHVRHHTLDLARIGKPAGTLRILHLTDFQTHAFREYERRVLRTAADQGADLIVFTGDYVQSRYRPTGRAAGGALRAFLQQEPLRARYGVYAVKGDVDDHKWPALFDGTGVRCLTDEHVTIPLAGGRVLTLTGLSLHHSRESDPQVMARLLGPSPAGGLHIVMGHAPDFVSAIPPGSGVDLALAGHTHGGQVVIPGFGPLMTKSRLPRRYAGGLNWFGEVPLHVSRGVGMERGLAPQVRFFCPPEICVLDVRY